MKFKKIAVIISIGALLGFSTPIFTHATLVEDLQKQINDRNQKIADLEKQIAQYEKQVSLTAAQAKTLKNLISTLDTTRKKLDADIAVTQNKIAATTYTIDQLHEQITDQEDQIEENRSALSETIRRMYQYEEISMLEGLLADISVSNILNEIQNLQDVQGKIKAHVDDIQKLKINLEGKKATSEQKKNDLEGLKQDLSGQKQVVVYDQQEKNKLLTQTKNQEAEYQKMIKETKAKKEAFEKELFEYESQLRIAIDPSSLPATQAGVLKWPLEKIIVTQYFGNTEFATKNAQIYNGKGHTGMDFGASIGTKVMSSADGVVAGTGNTDLVAGCYSYGKWVMVKHSNGLSTLYAHLSVISVSEGQSVSTGTTLGFSGNTGYSTGPHLHFGVYATQGVRITKFENSINCKGAVIPLADPKAYLNPLSYLPTMQ